MESLILKIIGVQTYCGVSRNGNPYILKTLELDLNGEKVKLKTFDVDASIGDFVKVALGVKKSIYGAELAPVLEKIISKNEIDREC